MTFLAKLGKFLAEGIAVLAGFGPLIAPYLGAKSNQVVSNITNDLTAVGQVVVQAEALIQGTGTGPQKLAAAAPLVVNIIKTSELISGHTIANNTLFMQGCTDLTSAVAEILNSLSADGVKSQGNPLPPTPPAQQAPVPASLTTPPSA